MARTDIDKIYDTVALIFGESNVSRARVIEYNPVTEIVFLRIYFKGGSVSLVSMPINDPYDVRLYGTHTINMGERWNSNDLSM